MIRKRIVEEARAWVGTPFQHQASLRGVGCDCIGLVRGVARAVGFADPFDTGAAREFVGYGMTPEPGRLRAAVERFLAPISLFDAQLGDILLMRFVREPQHFALISSLTPRAMVHCYSAIGRAAEHGIDRLWQRRIVGFYRYLELA